MEYERERVCCIIKSNGQKKERRGDGNSISLQQSSPVSVISPEAPSPNVSGGTDHRIPVPSPLTDTFKRVFEKAVDRARNELLSSGKIGLAVFFVYTNDERR